MIDLKKTRRISSLAMMCVIGIALLVPVCDSYATSWGAASPKGPEIVMVDLRWPEWDEGTYYCFWYKSLVPKGPTFYGGVAVHGPDQIPGMFQTYWGKTDVIYVGQEFYGKGAGAEGCKGGSSGSPSFQRPNSWYRMVMRVFPPTKDADKNTNIGWWVKDVGENKWYTHTVLSIPSVATGLSGADGGFVEAIGGGPETHRAFERRLGYCRLNGKWQKTNKVGSKQLSYFKLIENDTVLRFDCPVKDDKGGAKSDVYYTTKQPDTPPLDKPAIEQAEAYVWNNQLVVKWNVPQSASPQIGYKLEMFGKSGAKGTPLMTYEDASPHILTKRLDTDRAAKTVRLTVTDIFDQKKSITLPVKKATPLPAVKIPKLRPGLRYVYYEAPKDTKWDRLPDFKTLKPVGQGAVNVLDIRIRRLRNEQFALRYTGYLRAPADGLYVFSLKTSDGSRMSIDGKLIADNDGLHSTSEKQYQVALTKGLHSFELDYFRGFFKAEGSGRSIGKMFVSWEGPGFESRLLSHSDFMCKQLSDTPSITLASTSGDEVLKDNLVELRPGIKERGHAIKEVEYFCGDLLLVTVTEKPFALRMILPEGDNLVLARLWYDDNSSEDSNVLALKVQNSAGPWQCDVTDEAKEGLSMGFRSKGNEFSFIGEASCFAYQEVSGDFTLTARIADISLTSENGACELSWLGLNMTKPELRIAQTAGVGMRGASDYKDLCGTSMSIPRFTEGQWLRLVRRGKRYQSFVSVDGKTWQKTEERIGGGGKKDRAGLVFRTIPRAGRGWFSGTFDNVTLEKGQVPEEVREKPREQDLYLKNRVTALVQAQDNPEILYARSASQGLLKSKNSGKKWRPVNAGLTSSDELAIRSVAVNPEDSSVVLRGGGTVVDGSLKSGLWKSTNGGKSWKLVTREIDFDGRGPTTFFGEVIAFSPIDPNLVVAGGETSGLFISEDAGETWKCVGLKGERITCLTYKVAHIIVGTFADSEFEALGLGKPVSPVKGPGRIYYCVNNKKGMKQKIYYEANDFGVTGIVFNRKGGNHFATTRGVYAVMKGGLRQSLYQIPSDVLYTAVGGGVHTYAAPFSREKENRVYLTWWKRNIWSVLSDDQELKKIRGSLSSSGGKEELTMWEGYKSRKPGKDELVVPGLNAGGISCIWPDRKEMNTLYVCNRDGILKSTDHGKSYTLVYGSPAKR